MTPPYKSAGISSESSLSASGRSSEKLSLPSLQSKMKIDPEGYETELALVYNQFKASLDLFQQQAALSFTSISGVAADTSVAKNLGDRAMFLAHVTPFYSKQLAEFPKELAELLRSSARSLPSFLRCQVTQALILLINRQIVDIGETLALFMELQTYGDRNLRKLAFSHVVQSIKRMNQKHKNEAKNRTLQNVMFSMLQLEDEVLAKRSLITLCELHRRKMWFDDRTANAICTACFHSSSRIMIATLSFLLDYEKIEGHGNSDDSSDEDDETPLNPQIAIGKQAIYKAAHQGTLASKKKKKAKLQRVMRSMKRQHRMSSENSSSNHYSPLNHLKDPQGFAEKLFSRLQTCNERFEIKMMMLKVIARTIGLHRLIVLNFYPYLQKYVQPHQRDVTDLLAAAVQACHDMVPPDAVEPLFKQIVNQFVHDHSRTEAIAVGLNVVREICLRMPLLMNEDLLQDLVLYKKSHEKAVSVAARSLVTLFREICPSLLIKKDRGRPNNPTAKPKAFGERNVYSDVPGVELLNEDEDNSDKDDQENNDAHDDSEDELDQPLTDDEFGSENVLYEDSGTDDDEIQESDDSDDNNSTGDEDEDMNIDEEMKENGEEEGQDDGKQDAMDNEGQNKKPKSAKRKLIDFDVNTADTSLRALKRLATEANTNYTSSDMADGFLSNEEFQRIKELKAKMEANATLAKHGLIKMSIPTSDQLSAKRVDPAMLEVNIKKKLNKEERLALVKAGREDRGKYQARAAVKQKKTGGLSNKQKEHKKMMPLAAKRDKIGKTNSKRRKQEKTKGKQFRGRKAWK